MYKQYELDVNDTIEVDGITLYRVKCAILITVPSYEKERHNGYIESKRNLHQYGECMVFDNAKVYECGSLRSNAIAMGDATIRNSAAVSGRSVIRDNAIIKDHARIRENAVISDNAIVGGNASVAGNTTIGKDGYIMHDDDYITVKGLGSYNRYTTFYRTIDPKVIRVICGCFEGTLDEFEEKVIETHKDTKYAKEYLSIIQTVKIHFDLV